MLQLFKYDSDDSYETHLYYDYKTFFFNLIYISLKPLTCSVSN